MSSFPCLHVSLAGPLAALALIGFGSNAAAGADRTDDAPARPYTVFLGLDLTVEHRNVDCPVVQVDGANIEIIHDGNPLHIPSDEGNYKTTFSPHLGRSFLEVAQVRTKRVDSHGLERTRDAIAQGFLMESVRAQAQESAEIKMRNAELDLGRVQSLAAGGAPVDVAGARDRHDQAVAALNSSYAAPQFGSALQGANLSPPEDTGMGGPFDAYEVEFDISSPTEIENAFCVVRVVVRDPTNSRQLIPVIKFFKLSRIGPKVRAMKAVLKNLPQGFAVDGYAVHIFANGRELPTSISKNRVELSEDEAHQFLVLQYGQLNRQGSLPVAIIPDLLPPELSALIAGDTLNATVDVAIDREGRVTGIQQTYGIATTLTPELETALRRVRFLPALLNGNPVDGRGTFGLSEFVR